MSVIIAKIDKDRFDFEAHFGAEFDYTRKHYRTGTWQYMDEYARCAFAGWQAARATPQAPTPAAAEWQTKPAAWAVESNIGTGVRAFVKLCTEEGESDRFAARHQAAYSGAERVKVPLYRAAPLPRQAAVGEAQHALSAKHECVMRLAAKAIHNRGHEGDARLADSLLGVLAYLKSAAPQTVKDAK